MWSELPHQHHMVSRNGGTTAPAKLLVFFITPHGEKLKEISARKVTGIEDTVDQLRWMPNDRRLPREAQEVGLT
jgi:hypothetical protein